MKKTWLQRGFEVPSKTIHKERFDAFTDHKAKIKSFIK